MLTDSLSNQLLAILFVAREPVTLPQVKEVFAEASVDEIRTALERLLAGFNDLQGAVVIRRIAGGYRMTSRPEHHEVIRGYLRTRPSARLSLPALETLAVVAYRQPVTLPEINEIRGVRATATVRTLLEKKLIETRGRKKVVGRPVLYGTTQAFLVHFGLSDLTELPTLSEMEEILQGSET